MMNFDVEPGKSKDLCWYWDKEQAMTAIGCLDTCFNTSETDVYRCAQLCWYCLCVCMSVFFFFSRVLYVGSCRLDDRHSLCVLPSAQLAFENK